MRCTTDFVWMCLALGAVFAAAAPAALAGESAPTIPVNKLSPTGFIRDWLVVGGFPNRDILAAAPAQAPAAAAPAAPAAPVAPVGPAARAAAPGVRGMRGPQPLRTSSDGYEKDLLAPVGGEAAGTFAPDREVPYQDADGKPATAKPFSFSAASSGYVDLGAAFNNATHTVAYATCKVQADQAVRVTAYFGSDDSAKVWLNGRLVHSFWTDSRGAVRWSDTFPLDLKAGQNDLLVKVEQRTGGWGFYLELYRDEDMTAARVGRLDGVSLDGPTELPAGAAAVTGTLQPTPSDQPIDLPGAVSLFDITGRKLAEQTVRTCVPLSIPLPAGTAGYVEARYTVTRPSGSGLDGDARFYVGDYAAAKAALLEKAHAAMALLNAQLKDADPAKQRAARRQVPLARLAEQWLPWPFDVKQTANYEVFADMQPAIEAMARGAATAGGADYQLGHYGSLPAVLDLPEGMTMPAMTLWVSLPKGYAAGGPWPVVIHLHGSGGRNPWSPGTANPHEGAMWNYKFGKNMPYICITPATNAGWDPAILDLLLDHVLDAYNADPDRVALTGFSMGGMALYTWACARPDRFSALAALAGQPGRNDLSKIAHIPIWICHGERDEAVSFTAAIEGGKKLEALGAKVRYTTFPEQGHGIQANLQHTEEFWAWLASFKRQKAAEQAK